MTRKHTAVIGTISHGTLRSEDLIEAFADELKRLRGALPRAIRKDITAWRNEKDKDAAQEMGDELVQALEDALQEFAPAYGWFGSNPGDGSDFGFWIDTQGIGDVFEGLHVTDTADVPKRYRGEVLHTNDHGNVTLFRATSRGLREVWAFV